MLAGDANSLNLSFSNEVEEAYRTFLQAVYTSIRGNYDSARFEEKCRDILGVEAYLLFTFPKLANSAAKSF